MRIGTAVLIVLLSIGIGYFYSTNNLTSSSITNITSAIKHYFIPSTPTPPAPAPPANMLRRTIVKSFLAVEKSEGAGARVRRSIGIPQLRNFSPFLMLDHFTIGPGAGFPDHPHRGQETITYLLSGSVDHEDFTGSSGTIRAGDLQFMTAGRGIVHAEMPGAPDPTAPGAPNIGMQLWVDLPQHLKSCEPRYRDLPREEIPTATAPGGKVTIKIISGEALGVQSVKDLAYTPVWLLDITVRPGGRHIQALPAGWNAFMYVLSGAITVHTSSSPSSTDPGTRIRQFHNTVFTREGDGVEISVPEGVPEGEGAGEGEDARVFLVAGMVLEQEVVQYGPFVVSSQEEVYQAISDYQGFTGGFERARGWRSGIGGGR